MLRIISKIIGKVEKLAKHWGVSLKEAQKVNRLQVELMYLALCISLEQYLTKIAF